MPHAGHRDTFDILRSTDQTVIADSREDQLFMHRELLTINCADCAHGQQNYTLSPHLPT